MSRKLMAYFVEFKPFHKGDNKEFLIMEVKLNEDSRALSHKRTGNVVINEITEEEFKALTKKQQNNIMVREVAEVKPSLVLDVDGDGDIDLDDKKLLEEALEEVNEVLEELAEIEGEENGE